MAKIRRSREALEKIVASGRTVYGINTGFGKLADKRISEKDVLELQRRLVLSHATGVGPRLSAHETRLMMLFRANALAKGFSGCRVEMVQFLVDMLNRGARPDIPEQGSVGASGDLAPLAHLGVAMMGLDDTLRKAGLKPFVFREKEGLALINGVQFSLAVLAGAAVRAERLLKLADAIGSMTLDALMCSIRPFDPRIHRVRPHPGQAEVARNVLAMMQGSQILKAHEGCSRVQDNYSLRCMPQVHGAAREAFTWVRGIIVTEANAVSDNPVVFEEGDAISGGNFHAQIEGLAADTLANAMTTLINISERRIECMVNPDLSGLPAFLAAEGGLNSGFMLMQVAAAALTAESRSLCYPASVLSLPTSAGKEDVVSMAPISARHLRAIVDNLEYILAIEALTAAQALEFRKPLKAGKGIDAAYRHIRKSVAPMTRDRYLKPDLERVRELVRTDLLEVIEDAIGELV